MRRPDLRRVIAVLTLAVLPAMLFAQAVPSNLNQPVPFNPAIVTGKLDNGLRYFVFKNGKPANRLEMILVVNAGSVLEDDDQNGLAHFCEHMAFNGTKTFPKQDLVNFLESTGIRFGADLNAYTNQDETVYLLTIPTDKPSNVEKGLNVLRDWARFVTYNDADINDERGVILEEWRLGKGAQDRINEVHRHKMFYGSKYAQRDVIGDTNVLKRCPTDNLRRFYNTWYRPENMAVIVVGDGDPASIVSMIKKEFGFTGDKNTKAGVRTPMPLPQHKETLVSVATDKELTVASAQIIWKHPAAGSSTFADFRRNMVYQFVGNMLNQRLADLARKPNPPFLGASASETGLTRETSAFMAAAAASDKDVRKSINALYTEVLRADRHGFTQAELDRARTQFMAGMEKYYNERDKSESQQFANELVRHFLRNEGVPGIAAEYAIYQQMAPAISLADVNAAVKAAVTDENRVVMVAVPDAPGYVVPTESQIKELLAAVEGKTITAYVDDAPAKPLMPTKPKAGSITKKETIGDIDAVKLTLSNGAVVFYKKTDFKNDEVLFHATSWGGTNMVSVADLPSASNAASIVDLGGIADVDASALQKMLAGKTIGISPYIGAEAEGFEGSTTPKDMETFFELLHLYFTSPRKDKDAFTSFIQKSRTALENKGKNPEAVFGDTVLVTMTQYSPRVQPMTVATLDKINLDKAYDIYRQRFASAGDFTYYFVGNLDPATLESYVATYIASLPAGTKESYKDNGVRAPKGTVAKTVVAGQEPRSTVLMMLHGSMDYTPEARYDIVALTEVINIRLREQMREEKGGVYFVSVQPNFEKRPESEFAISVYFSCDPSRVDELKNVVTQEIAWLQKNTVEDSYIQKVREIQLKEREVGMKTNGFWMGTMRTADRDNEPFSVILRRPAMIKALTAAQVRKAAGTYLSTKNVATFILKPQVQ